MGYRSPTPLTPRRAEAEAAADLDAARRIFDTLAGSTRPLGRVELLDLVAAGGLPRLFAARVFGEMIAAGRVTTGIAERQIMGEGGPVTIRVAVFSAAEGGRP